MKEEMKNKNTKGFTVVELLVVIAVLGLIASIILVATKGSREKAEITAVFQHAAAVNHFLGSDLAGEWKFDDSTLPLANRGKDTSGNGNDFTQFGTINYIASFLNQAGTAAQFNVDSYLRRVGLPQNNRLNLGGGDVTLASWVKLNSTGNYNVKIFSYYEDAGAEPYLYLLSLVGNGKILMGISETGGVVQREVTANKSLDYNKWYFVVGTYNNTTKYVTIYLNGKQDKNEQINISFGQSPAPAYIYVAYSYEGNLTLDEVRVYGRALPTAQIQQLYAEGAAKREMAVED